MKLALVTGGSRGIGRATARLLAARGYRVAVNYRQREEEARQVVAQIQQQALWLPLAHPTAFALTRKDVQGYSVSPFGRQDYSRVNLK